MTAVGLWQELDALCDRMGGDAACKQCDAQNRYLELIDIRDRYEPNDDKEA